MADKTERISASAFRELPVAKRGRKAAVVPVPALVNPVFEGPTAAPHGRSYTFTYSGKGISSNAFYAGMHWAKRKALVADYHAKFAPLLAAAGIEPMQRFRLGVCYHSKQDVDNVTALVKVAVDLLKGRYVPEDSPQHFKGLSIEYSPGLPKNTFVFTLTELL